MFYVIIVFIYLHYQKISSPKTNKKLHITFEKIKWSVYNINELSLVEISGFEPEPNEPKSFVLPLWERN